MIQHKQPNFLPILFLLLLTPACKNLDETFYDQESPKDFFKTEKGFIVLIGTAYSELYAFQNHGGYMATQEVSSDEIMIPQRGNDWGDDQWVRAHRHEYSPNHNGILNAWTMLYSGVNTCNRLIFQISQLTDQGIVDGTMAGPFLSELHVLRALWYFWLLDSFGNVPIIDRYDLPGNFQPANNTRSEVFAFIEKELLEHVPLLTKEKKPATYGRMTYYAGQALLAKLYLNAQVYKGVPEYAKSIAACDEIINSGKYSLEADYFSNFNSANEGSVENILVIPYDKTNAPGFNLAHMTLHYNSQSTFRLTEQPWNGYCSLQEFYESYGDDDKRKGVWGNQKIRGNFFAGPQYEADGVTPVKDPAADDPDGENLVFTPEINQHFPSCFRQAGVRIGKFEIPSGATTNLSNDFPIFRYADILLTKAEALWRQDPASVEALTLVNQIRTRARVAPFAALSAGNLLAERGRELFYEAWRRQDLIRFGVFGNARRWQPASDKNKEIWPIPRAVLQAGSNLKQNPGY